MPTMEIKDHYLMNEIIVYSIPGSLFLILFFLVDIEFNGGNIYTNTNINGLLSECDSFTIRTAMTGIIILLALPYFLGHIISFLSYPLMALFNLINFFKPKYIKKELGQEGLLRYLIQYLSNFFIIIFNSFNQEYYRYELEKENSKVFKKNDRKINDIYQEIIFNEQKILPTIFRYYTYYKFMRSMIVVFMMLFLTVLLVGFLNSTCFNSDEKKCCSIKQSINPGGCQGRCSTTQDAYGNANTTSVQNVHGNANTPPPLLSINPTIFIFMIFVYLALIIISWLAAKRYYEKYIRTILYTDSLASK